MVKKKKIPNLFSDFSTTHLKNGAIAAVYQQGRAYERLLHNIWKSQSDEPLFAMTYAEHLLRRGHTGKASLPLDALFSRKTNTEELAHIAFENGCFNVCHKLLNKATKGTPPHKIKSDLTLLIYAVLRSPEVKSKSVGFSKKSIGRKYAHLINKSRSQLLEEVGYCPRNDFQETANLPRSATPCATGLVVQKCDKGANSPSSRQMAHT